MCLRWTQVISGMISKQTIGKYLQAMGAVMLKEVIDNQKKKKKEKIRNSLICHLCFIFYFFSPHVNGTYHAYLQIG